MMLYRWQGPARNFGDELNTVLWPALLPDFFDLNPSVRFLGIGSVLDSRHGGPVLKLVAGAGYGGYERPPVLDETWIIHWVRGPLTARRLGLPDAMALGDPAVLLPLALAATSPSGPSPAGLSSSGNSLPETSQPGIAPVSASQPGSAIGFMPHFESAEHGRWSAIAQQTGLRLIDPRGDPRAIIAAIGECRTLVSEALHGVIVADTLRVPWIAIEPFAAVHRPKWQDWAATMDLKIAFRRLVASDMLEWARGSGLARLHNGRRMLQQHGDWLHRLGASWLQDRAAGALCRAAAQTPQLSSPSVLARRQARMLDRLDALRLSPACGTFVRRRRPALQTQVLPAYEPRLIG